jgi:tripartite-type tricarboxylate transporter receptor subunit TctC
MNYKKEIGMNLSFGRFVVGTLAAFFWGVSALAQAWPDRAITLIVPFAPGASSDALARLLATQLSQSLGKPVVVENRAGAGGATGLITVSRAPADGYTLGMGATGALVINPHIPNSPPLEPLSQLTPIAKLADIPLVVVASRRSGLRNLRQVIDAAAVKPEALSWGSTGSNTAQHLSGELLAQMAHVQMVHVPYRGSSPAVIDLLAGSTPVAIVDLTSAQTHIKAGTLVGIALTSPTRSVTAPEIPTVAESGLPGYAATAWMGVFGPAGLPPVVTERLTREIKAILAKPDVQDRALALGTEPSYLDDQAFKAFITGESQKWKKLIGSLPPEKK